MNERTLKVLEYNKIIDMLIGCTLSPMGAELSNELLPSSNINEVRIMQQETSEAVIIILRKGSVPLEGLNDIRGGLKKAEIGSILEPRDLLKISDHLRCARNMKSFLKQDIKETFALIDDLSEGLNSIKSLEDEINNCIISEEEISDRASTTLFNIRRQIREKNNSVRDKLNSIIRSGENSKYLQDPIVTVRGDRFVVPVKSEFKGNFQGLVHDQSSSGSTLFIEPMAVVEMNNDIKELKSKERKEIERILSVLTQNVAEYIDTININNDILSRFDFIFAKAKLAIELKCMPPVVNNEGYINIKNGRHPLIKEDTVVPNTIYMGKDFNIMVITGPNTGGKTVTLKTTGLLVLMSMAGLQIPVDDGSSISVFDQVFADIGDEQSIEQSLSTFSSHMTNIVTIMKEATADTLCLFDELGAGTDPTEGAALAMAILDDLYSRGTRVIATTHYSELKVFALQRNGIENASVEFNVETLSPTYKLLIGVPGKSNAFEISKRLGLEDYIINKAHDLISDKNLEFENLISDLHQNKKVAEEEREEAEKLRIEAQIMHRDYKMNKDKLDKARNTVINEARQESKRILKQAKDDADEIIKEIRKSANIHSESERNKKIEESRVKLRESIGNIEESIAKSLIDRNNLKPIRNLKAGDDVFIVSLNKAGTVVSPPDGKGDVIVQVGIMKINANISGLMVKERANKKSEGANISATLLINREKSITSSVDLRGQTLDEALINTDKYLDDAYLSYFNEVTIIHGKGTGVLRQGIMDMLKHHSHVKSSRPGKYGEGGIGVTIVEIKR